MSTFNAEIYIGNRGNTILSFDLYLGTGTTQNYNCNPDSGVTFSNTIHSGTTRGLYQDVLWSDMYSGQTLFVDSIPMGTTHIKVVANRLSGVCSSLQPLIICIENRPTPTPTPSSTPTSTPTPTPTPTSSPTPTPTPTATDVPPTPTPTPTSTNVPPPTPTTSPTPTPTNNVDVDPTYFYYALGDCSDMRYVYTSYTATGLSPLIVVPGCETLSQIGLMSVENAAHTSYVLAEPLDPCGFGENYSGVGIARSSSGITEGTVYNVGNLCLSVIAVQTEYVESWSVDLDGLTPVGIGDSACGSCSPPFTGYTITGYSGVTCDTGESIIVYSALGGFTIGNVYGIQLFSGGTAQGDARCMTLNANIGPQFTLTDPINDPLVGYQITDAGPIQIPVTFSGYSNCDACEGIVVDGGKYQIDAERCDNPSFSVTLWSDTAPTVVSGNTIQISGPLSEYCWRVTLANQFKSSVGVDLGYTIIDTGCDCNGDNGGNTDLASVSNLFASMSDEQGEIYVNSQITLSNSIDVNTTFEISVDTSLYNTVTVSITITAGNTSGTGSTYVGMGSMGDVTSSCIQSHDTFITTTGFDC
jgi:hypothetical protein